MRNGELVIYLDRFQTNEPITGAKISVETPKGPQEAKESNGTYRLDAPWAKDASIDLIFTVIDGDTSEILTGTLALPDARDDSRQGWSLFSPAFAHDLKDKITSGGVWLLALITFVLGFAIARFTGRRGKILSFLVLLSFVGLGPDLALAHEGEDHGDTKKAPSLSSDISQRLGGLAIAIGELVDDAVVDVENIFRRLRENREQGSPRSTFEVVVSASNEVRSGIVYATLIIVLVFVPLFALSGIEGRLFAPLGQAYIISILASLVVSVTLTPVMAYYMLPSLKRLGEHESWLVRNLKARNRRLLDFAFQHQRTVLVATVAAVALAAVGALTLPRAFLPPFNEGTFTINMLFNPGIALGESNRVGLIAEKLILEVPEVKAVE